MVDFIEKINEYIYNRGTRDEKCFSKRAMLFEL